LNVIKTNTLDDLGIDYKDNVYYVIVTDIENSSSEVYDLEIDDDSHTYVINNVITHNTINAPEETTVEDIKRLILMGHELNIKGLTIFRENCNRDSLIKCEDCKI
jgi:ribonucleoside-diphosphate reductase alpha chain